MSDPTRDTPVELRPRVQPVQRRSQRSRRKLLETAYALLKAHGVHQLTTVAIAEASGVSIGALYRFFPNKEAIVCQIYEEKLIEIRKLALDIRPDEPEASWRSFFKGYFLALKAAEREVDFDHSLADAIFILPQLWAIDLRHGMILADQLAADMKQRGSPWSDAALFDLAINLYAIDSSVWMYWRYAQRYPILAIERAIEASLGMMRPAMEGEPEPDELGVSRDHLLASLAEQHS